jgi:chemotaxis protein CheC
VQIESIDQQQVELWAEMLNNTSVEGMLHTTMRHVALNLSDMIGRPVVIDNLGLETLPVSHLNVFTDNPEAETVGVYLLIGDELLGEAILILSLADAMQLADWLLEVEPGTTSNLGSLERSALAELGNVMLSSFLNSMADFTGIPMRPSPPTMALDMLASILEAVAMSMAAVTEEVLIIKTDFISVNGDLPIRFWVLPDPAILIVDLVKPAKSQELDDD